MAARGSYAKTPGRRAEILDAAVEIFSRSGFVGGSIREIAELLGVSHPTLIFHFRTKEELLAAALERSEQSYLPLLDQASEDPIGFIASALDVFRRRPTVPGESEMILRLATEAATPAHPAHPYLVRRYRRLLDVFSSVFSTLDALGLLKQPADFAQLARFTVALMDGLQISARYDPAPSAVMPDLADHFDRLLNARGRRALAVRRQRLADAAAAETS